MKDLINTNSLEISQECALRLRAFRPNSSAMDSAYRLMRLHERVVADAYRVAEKFTSDQLDYFETNIRFGMICPDSDRHLADQLVECIKNDDPEDDEDRVLPVDWHGMFRTTQNLGAGEQIALIHLLEGRAELTDMIVDSDDD